MYSLVIILSIVIVTAFVKNLNKKQCREVFHPNAMLCCKKTSDAVYKNMVADDLKECYQVSKDPVSCEREQCIAKKQGFATYDNKIDKKKLEEFMTKDFGSDADLLEDLKSKCLNGDVDDYAPPEFCELMKMKHCISMQMLNHCLEWNNNTDCQEMKELIEECVKIIS